MINITTPNLTNTFFVKADGADYIQCPVAEAEGIAVLRYIPVGADSVEGEVYANGTALKRMLPTTVTFTAIGITHIDIFTKKHSDSTWLQVGKSLDALSGSAEFRLLPSDFVVGDVIDLKLKDVDTDVSAISESLEILPSFTLDVYPTGAKALESAQAFSGTGLSGKQLTITLTSTTGEKVITTTPVLGVWSEDIALTTDEDGFEPDDDVNVSIERTSYDQKDYGELYSVSGSIEIDDSVEPFVTDNIELDSAFDVTVDSNLEGKTVIIEASNGGSWVEIGTGVVSSGTVTVSCTVPSSDFNANDNITVRARYGTVASIGVILIVIATITITGTPTTAGVEENLTGASNGLEVEGFYRLSSAVDWTSAGTVSTVLGDYTIPITIADADTYDFKVEDTTNRDGEIQLDDVVVASGVKDWAEIVDSATFSDRSGHAMLTLGTKIYVIGGKDGTNYFNSVYSSTDGENFTEILADTGSPGVNQFRRLAYMGACVYDNKLWIVGGRDGSATYMEVWSSADGITWTRTASSISGAVARHTFPMLVYGGKMWFFGGRNGTSGSNIYNDVFYSTDGVTWTSALPSSHWNARTGHTGLVFDNKMWIVGGFDIGGNYKSDVWYSTDGQTWTRTTDAAGFGQRGFHVSQVFDSKMWVISGRTDVAGTRADQNDSWHSADGSTWTQATPDTTFEVRYLLSSCLFNSAIYISGGIGATYYNDVWRYK